ncbi:glutathione hydrolase 1 proenzyme-like [Glandiceps talaboti]
MSKGRVSLICCLIIVSSTAITLAVIFGVKHGQCVIGFCSKDGEITENSTRGFHYQNAAVAADNGNCSKVGSDMLENGGNAVDAAIAALLCDSVVNPHSLGPGGGHFMIVYNKEKGKVVAIDAREEAPGNANQTMFTDSKIPDASVKGGLSIGVPGEIDGFWMAHLHFGNLPWKDLFQPAITMAEDGIAVGPALADAIEDKADDITSDPNLREVFTKNGDILREGDIMTRPKYAETLRRIAAGSSDTFYLGRLAYDIVADIQDRGGIITVDDLRNYRAKLKDPLKTTIKEYTMYSMPPPSSGGVLSLILNILEGYNFNATNTSTKEERGLTYHRIIEAFKYAYALRTQLADEDYVDLTALINDLVSDDYADQLRGRIDEQNTHDISYYGADFYYIPEDAGTAHLSVVDQYGNAVSVTSTINLRFGSKVLGSRTGILFNDEMDDFSSPNIVNTFGLPPSEANFIEPGKRPLSSMTPTIIIDQNGDAKFVLGAAGGSKIITACALATLNTLWFGDDIKTAIQRPRLHHQLTPNKVRHEQNFDNEILDILEKTYGHELELLTTSSVITAVLREEDGFYAYSDDRKAGGYPAGF